MMTASTFGLRVDFAEVVVAADLEAVLRVLIDGVGAVACVHVADGDEVDVA